MSDIYIRHGNHWRKAQRRRLPEPPNPPPEPPRRERGPGTLDSLLVGKRRKPPCKYGVSVLMSLPDEQNLLKVEPGAA